MNHSNYKPLDSIIIVPAATSSLEGFAETTKQNVGKVFGIDVADLTSAEGYALGLFLENDDHGAEHVYNVYKKACDIADRVLRETGEKVDASMLYAMIAFHDSGRFHIGKPEPETGDPVADTKRKKGNEKKAKKAKRADSKHELYGVSQLKKGLALLHKKGVDIDPMIEAKMTDYIYNHDYMNPQLNGNRYHEPRSLEGQIARLADRISTDAITEIERYRTTGKRLGTKFYDENISFDDRAQFRFTRTGEYIKAGKLDQFMFFATLLAVKASDFEHPELQKIYSEWAPQKRAAADHILVMAKREGFSDNLIATMKHTLRQYSKEYEFDFS